MFHFLILLVTPTIALKINSHQIPLNEEPVLDCGGTKAGDYSCESHVEGVMENLEKSEDDARSSIYYEFSEECFCYCGGNMARDMHGEYSCEDRLQWVEKNEPNNDAQSKIYNEFSEECVCYKPVLDCGGNMAGDYSCESRVEWVIKENYEKSPDEAESQIFFEHSEECSCYKPAPEHSSVEVSGDPHAVNMKGEKFDILSLGYTTLVRYPLEASPSTSDLFVSVDIQRVGEECRLSFMKTINISGTWVHHKELSFRAPDEDSHPLQTLVDGKWKVVSKNMSSHMTPAEMNVFSQRKVHLRINGVNVTMSTRRHQTWNFLDLHVEGLWRLENKVGGILGLDSHEDVQKTEHCTQEHTSEKQERLFHIGTK